MEGLDYRSYAFGLGCKRLREVEAGVLTPTLLRIEAADPERRLVGLEHRLMTAERLLAKVERHLRADPDSSFEEAFSQVTDAIRYTFCYPEESYTDGVATDCDRLRAAGFEPVDLRNSWGTRECPGISSRWRVAGTDQLFEVQFHTEASWQAPASEVAVPPGAADIPGYW